MKVVGLDLAGISSRPTGTAVAKNKKITTFLLHSDQEIISTCNEENPDVIAIDAPLSKPRKGGLRTCDRELISKGLRVFPPLFGGMKKLTSRGIKIAKKLRLQKHAVIEVHPRTSGRLLFGTSDREVWIRKLKNLGFNLEGVKTEHEIDAVLAAITGELHLKGKTDEIGKRAKIIVPLPKTLYTP